MNETIKIRGARTHNLKNINLDIPRNQLVVITGLSALVQGHWKPPPLYGRDRDAWKLPDDLRSHLGKDA